jgi:hypothetical protein
VLFCAPQLGHSDQTAKISIPDLILHKHRQTCPPSKVSSAPTRDWIPNSFALA